MNAILVAVRLALAALLAAAGAAKVADRPGSDLAARRLGVPARLAGPVALAVPAVELLIAVGLAIPVTVRTAAASTVALLGAFTVVVAANLRAGRRVPCACFGTLTRAHTGGKLIARNAGLAGLALLIAAGGPGRVALPAAPWLWHGAATAAWPALLLASLLVSAACLRELANDRRRARSAGPPLDGGLARRTPAPALHLIDGTGQPVTITPGRHPDERHLLLLFLEPGCPPCERLLPVVGQRQRDGRDGRRTLVIVDADPASAAAAARDHDLLEVYAQPDRQAARAYRIPGTPSGVLVDAAGRVRTPLVAGYEAVHALIRQT